MSSFDTPKDLFFGLVAPFMGSLLASVMFAAPIRDLREALLRGQLDDLNPRPWAVMTGNCLGWCAYGYYQLDIFVFMGNLPGLVLSLWLNLGAAKLQYKFLSTQGGLLLRRSDEEDGTGEYALQHHPSYANFSQVFVWTPQEVWFLSMVTFWSLVLVLVGWIPYMEPHAATIIGWTVNLNLIFFYGAPLQTIQQVVVSRRSNSIHRPTLWLSCTNTTFWLLYGIARQDVIIVLPNGTGLCLSVTQALLCLWYPRRVEPSSRQQHPTEMHRPEVEIGTTKGRGFRDAQHHNHEAPPEAFVPPGN